MDEKTKMELKSLIAAELATVSKEIVTVSKDLQDLRAEMKPNFDNLNTKFENLHKSLTKQINGIKETSAQQTKKVVAIAASVDNLEKKVDDLEDRHRRSCRLILNGVPYKPNENLLKILDVLTSKIGYTQQIDAKPFRFQSADMSKQPIVIKFPTEYDKDDYLERFFKVKNPTRSLFPGFDGDNERIFLYHDLSSVQYNINKIANKLFKDGSIFKRKILQGRVSIQFKKNDKPSTFHSIDEFKKEAEKFIKSQEKQIAT